MAGFLIAHSGYVAVAVIIVCAAEIVRGALKR